ncbi:MAG: hypothetical protein ACRD2H_11665 [Terriglobales bacterium]
MTMAAKAAGLGLSLRLPFRKWLAVKAWLLLMLLEDLAIYTVLWLGFDPKTSIVYAQVYYWSDLIVVFAGLLVLLRVAETAFKNTRVDLPLLRAIAIAVIAGIGVVSFVTVFSKLGPAALSFRHLTAFATEAEQNMAVAGMLGSFVLWGAIGMLRVPGVRVRRITAGCGIFYSASACGWSLVALFGYSLSLAVPLLSLASIVLLAYAMAERDDAKPEQPRRRRADVPMALPERGAA